MAHSTQFLDEDAAAPTTGTSRNLLQVLWRRKALILLGAVTGLVIGSLIYTQQAPVYQSTARVLVIKKRLAEPLSVNGSAFGATFVEDYLSTHVEVLKSPTIIELAVKKSNLHELKSFENRDPVGAIQGALHVARDNSKDSSSGPNNIVNLSFRGPVSEDCPRVINAIIDTYKEFLDQTYRKNSDQTVELIFKARDKFNKERKESSEKYRQFLMNSPGLVKMQNGSTVSQSNIQVVVTRQSAIMLRQAELAEKIKAMEDALQKKLYREAMSVAQAQQKESKTPSPKAEDNSLEIQMLPLLAEEQKLLVDYGPDNPRVIAVRKQLGVYRDFQKKLASKQAKKDTKETGKSAEIPLNPIESYLFALRNELMEVTNEYQSLTEKLVKLRKEARDQISTEQEEASLRGDVKRAEDFLDATLKRLSEVDMVKDAGGFDARVLAKPGLGFQVAPVALQTILFGFVLGALAGVGLGYLAEFSDRGFRSSEEVRKRLGLPLVGHIPFLKPDPEAVLQASTGKPTPDPMLVAYYRSMSIEAEAYRAVRTALFFSTQDAGHRIIQVTSPSKGDGKSLLIGNLAVSIAQAGKTVILIDADCRRPRQHKVFALSGNVGLVNVLAGEVDAQAAIQPTCTPGLDVLPAGPIRQNPAELLTSPRFQNLLDTVRKEYDYVLVDTPPLLAVTDPCVVASRVDGMFLVIRLSRDARPKAERAREILDSLGVKVHGVVVNGITRAGGAGLYASERYDYTENYENYEETDEEDGDGYYTADPEPSANEDTLPKSPGEQVASVANHLPHAKSSGQGSSRGGLLGWLIKWWA